MSGSFHKKLDENRKAGPIRALRSSQISRKNVSILNWKRAKRKRKKAQEGSEGKIGEMEQCVECKQ